MSDSPLIVTCKYDIINVKEVIILHITYVIQKYIKNVIELFYWTGEWLVPKEINCIQISMYTVSELYLKLENIVNVK